MNRIVSERTTSQQRATRSPAQIRWARLGMCLCGFGLAHAFALLVPQCVRLPGQSAAVAAYKLDAANLEREVLVFVIISALVLVYPVDKHRRPFSRDRYAKRRTPLAGALKCSGKIGLYTFFLLLLFGTASHSLADVDWLELAAAYALMVASICGFYAIAYFLYPPPPGYTAPPEVADSNVASVI